MLNKNFKQLDLNFSCMALLSDKPMPIIFFQLFSKESEYKSKHNRRKTFYNEQTTLFSILLVVRSDQRQRASNPDPFESRFNALKLPQSHRHVAIVNKKESEILTTAIC